MADSPRAYISAPVIVDLGKVKRKQIKQLKRGTGDLILEVREAVEEVVAGLGEEANGREFIPIVVLYREKTKKPKNPFWSIWD